MGTLMQLTTLSSFLSKQSSTSQGLGRTSYQRADFYSNIANQRVSFQRWFIWRCLVKLVGNPGTWPLTRNLHTQLSWTTLCLSRICFCLSWRLTYQSIPIWSMHGGGLSTLHSLLKDLVRRWLCKRLTHWDHHDYRVWCRVQIERRS